MKRIATIVCFCGLWSCVTVASGEEGADDRQIMRQSLKGFSSVHVSVSIKTASEQGGMTVSELKTYIELELRKFGVPVHTGALDDKSFHAIAELCLYVYSTEPFDFPVYGKIRAFTFQLQVTQPVSLLRDPSLKAPASTWLSDRITGFDALGMPLFRQTTEQNVSRLTRQFANDYLAANPKE